MPTNSSGTIIATSICQTSNIYATGTLTTSTTVCYRSQDIYFGIAIEGAFFFATILTLFKIAKVMKNQI